jgi:hypothetical protein
MNLSQCMETSFVKGVAVGCCAGAAVVAGMYYAYSHTPTATRVAAGDGTRPSDGDAAAAAAAAAPPHTLAGMVTDAVGLEDRILRKAETVLQRRTNRWIV